MTKFNRTAVLGIDLTNSTRTGYIGSIKLTNLRISFTIQKNLAWSTNTCSVSIWNLSQSNRNRLKDFGDRITLSAGYVDETGPEILFIGDSSQVSHAYSQPDIITTIECGDGDKVLNNVRISVSFQANTPVRQVIETIAQQMGLALVEFIVPANKVYEFGFSFVGMAKDGLDTACNYLGVKWSVQNTGLHILPVDGATQRPPFLINADTGMIGVPQRYTYKRRDLYRSGPNPGWIVQTSLNPQILPGDKVNIVSTRVDLPSGTFQVYSIRHEGDTYGANWRSSLEVILL